MKRKAVLLLALALACTGATQAEAPVIDATLATVTGVSAPQGIAVHAAGGLVYAASGATGILTWTASQGCQGNPTISASGSVAIVAIAGRTKVADIAEAGRPVHAELDVATGNVHVVGTPGVSVYAGTTRVRAASPIGGAPHDIGIDSALGLGLVTNTFDTSGQNANQTWVSLTELATGRVLASTNPGGVGPHKAAVDPERHLAYVSHAEAPQVDVIDLRTGALLRKITTGVTRGAAQNAIDLVRRRLYVIGDSGSPQTKVVAVDLATEQPMATVLLPFPRSVRVDPATGLVWLALAPSGPNLPPWGLVSVLDPDSLAERARLKVGHCPYYLDFDTTARTAWVTNEADDSLTVLDMTRVPPGADADRVFNWAEQQYPQYFPSRYRLSTTASGYYYRHYTASNTYLGAANGRVYVYGPGSFGPDILDVGALAGYLQQAQAAGF